MGGGAAKCWYRMIKVMMLERYSKEEVRRQNHNEKDRMAGTVW